MSDKFDNFIKQQAANKKKEEAVDWNKNLEEWISFVDELYLSIKNYLANYIKEGLVSFNIEKILISEEYIGSYQIDKLVISVGNEDVSLTPIGTLIVGSKGRVDMSGRHGTISFLLVNKLASKFGFKFQSVRLGEKPNVITPDTSIVWAWKILNRGPEVQFLELNEDSFRSSFLKVANG